MDGPALNPIVVLGATGSIGSQTLDVADRLNRPVRGLAAGSLSDEIADLAGRYPEACVAVARTPEHPIDAALERRIEFGPEAVVALARRPDSTVVNGIVGAAGLEPSLAALGSGNRLALANKESLLTGGSLVLSALESGGGELVPVDSEHSAIWQCIEGESVEGIRRVILTASGGPFHSRPDVDLGGVSVADALAHPTWDMGRRISIDSATLMNKAFEVIEAHFLFNLDYDQIDVVIHPGSFVHSLVEFVDGVVKAELGSPDMRKPIQRALTWPGRMPAPAAPIDLVGTALSFSAPDRTRFPALDLGYEAGRRGGNGPAVLNAADEVAVGAFLDGRIRFAEIVDVVANALESVPPEPIATLAEALAADAAGRAAATEWIARRASR
ncbi:MAG: 1-deoxy-D-xylulose-5-phosphate reductoisomerase [Actinomycetota bacterium]|nr:1-deoxy-D-xylulose-5-phosphate reductoisomerase [Actinomycetota bacterium]